MADQERHVVECTLTVVNAAGKRTAYATIGLGEMRLEDVCKTEKALLETFLLLLSKQ